MTLTANIDFETRSECDLKLHGNVRYAMHPTTQVLCADIAWRGRHIMFVPGVNRARVLEVIKDIHESGARISAYNWTFEYLLMRFVCPRLYDWPEFAADRFDCSRALALRHGLCGNLEADSGFIGKMRKDDVGKRIMLQLTKPRARRKGEPNDGRTYWFTDAGKYSSTINYCRDDVRAERSVQEFCPPLSKREEAVFRMDQRMNLRGIAVDTAMCRGALQVFESYRNDLKRLVPAKFWKHHSTLSPQAVRPFLYKHYDVDLPNMQQDTVTHALAFGVPNKARNLMVAYLESRGQSGNKYNAALRMHMFGRVYFNLQYCGARATGRWSGQNIQLHNMNRPNIPYDDRNIAVLLSGDFKQAAKRAKKIKTYDGAQATVSDLLKSCMRSMLIPDHNRVFAVNDYSAVEARKVMWYCGCDIGLQQLASGVDQYRWMAGEIYGVPVVDVDDLQRFVGKQSILGAGYGMGASRFQGQCLDYGVALDMGLCGRTINTYRSRYKEVPAMWRKLEVVAKFVIGTKRGRWKECGRVKYRYRDGNLECRLPNGTILMYHRATIDREGSIRYYTVARVGKALMRERVTWGGTLLENICQASARELMADAMLSLEAEGYPLALTVHDEIINQVRENADNTTIQEIIQSVEPWASTFPSKVEGKLVQRYQKI